MKYIDEFRNPSIVKDIIISINKLINKKKTYKIMEICGTHTVSISKYGIRNLLPKNIHLISGPGCPVCVTSQSEIDAIFSLISERDVLLAVYGDLMKVPGSYGENLLDLRARGREVVIVNSVLDVIKLAASTKKEVVFVSIGFETTTPQTAYLILEAYLRQINNLSVLLYNKTMPEVVSLLLKDEQLSIDGFLCPGHVTTVTGEELYYPMVQYKKAAVISGFEPIDILQSILTIVEQVNTQKFNIVNNYRRVVSGSKNMKAYNLMEKVFEVSDAIWRGLGVIPKSGLKIKEEYAHFDAIKKYGVEIKKYSEKKGCRCGDVLKGYVKPTECEMFASSCTPENPFGPCMVSHEGTCAAFYQFGDECE
jgi:hydrogenase expression/formation protein HypD